MRRQVCRREDSSRDARGSSVRKYHLGHQARVSDSGCLSVHFSISRKIKSIHIVGEPTYCLAFDHEARSFWKCLKVFKSRYWVMVILTAEGFSSVSSCRNSLLEGQMSDHLLSVL